MTAWLAGGTLDGIAVIAFAVALGALCCLTLFFAASVLGLRIKNARRERRWSQLEQRWGPLMLGVVTGDTLPSRAWSGVARREREEFLTFLVRYARRLRGPEREAVEALARPYLGLLVPRISRGRAEERARAAQTLGLLGPGAHAPALVRALSDESPLVVLAAARGLARSGQERHLPALLRRLDRFAHWHPRLLAGVLAGIGAGAAPALRELLENRTAPPGARAIAAEALRQIGDLQAADTAAAMLTADTPPELAVALARLLARLGGPDHVAVLRPLLSAPNEGVRAHAIRGLARLGGRAELPTLLAKLSDDPSIWVALQAGAGVHAVGGREELRQLAGSGHPRSDVAREVLALRGAA